MFGLDTIRRMNDDAAIREQFPDHDCTESEEVAFMLDDYVTHDAFREVLENHRGLNDLVQELIARLPENDMADRLDKRDYENRAEMFQEDYSQIGY